MKKAILTTIILTLVFHCSFCQVKLDTLDFLIGNWQGVETGVAGNGVGFRTYNYILGDNFIFLENQSTFPISEDKPRGEVHRDKGIFSFNSNNSALVFREFHVEGFAIVYELDTVQSTGSKYVFLSRDIENNPGNWKAKLVLTQNGEDRFTEEFFIAMDGVNFKSFLINDWTKVK